MPATTTTSAVDALFASAPPAPAVAAAAPPAESQDPNAAVDALFAAAAKSDQASNPAPQQNDLTDRLAKLAGRYAGPFGQQLIRQTGLAGRAVAEAAQRTANILPDATNAVLQLATDPQARAATATQLSHPSTWLTMPANAPSSIVSRVLGRALPTPQTGPEKFASTVEGLMAGSRMPLLPGVARPTTAASGLTTTGLTDAQKAAAAGGRALGMKLTPGQATGSRALQQVEARLESNPWTSGAFNGLKAGNQGALNRTAAASIGENANTVDSTVLSRANDRLGDVFNSVRSSNRAVMADPKATQAALDKVDQDFEGLLPGDMSIRDNKLVQQLDTLTQRGHINGQQLGQLSSKLGRAAFKQMTSPAGDRDLGKALYGVKDHVDDLVQSTLSPEEAKEYADARGQYRNLMTLTSRTSIVNPSSGNVSGTALASKLQQADKPGFLYGRNTSPLYQAARFAQAFKPAIGDSGTATRSGGGHAGLWSGALLADALARGAPLEHAIGEAAIPFALRVGSKLGTRAYLTRPGAALVRGGMALPGATARFARLLGTNPALLPSLISRAPRFAPVMLPAAAGAQARAPAGLPLGAVHVRHGPGRHSVILPPAYPGGAPQRLDGLLGMQ